MIQGGQIISKSMIGLFPMKARIILILGLLVNIYISQ